MLNDERVYRLSLDLSCQFVEVKDTLELNVAEQKNRRDKLIIFWPEGCLYHAFEAGGQDQKGAGCSPRHSALGELLK